MLIETFAERDGADGLGDFELFCGRAGGQRDLQRPAIPADHIFVVDWRVDRRAIERGDRERFG